MKVKGHTRGGDCVILMLLVVIILVDLSIMIISLAKLLIPVVDVK